MNPEDRQVDRLMKAKERVARGRETRSNLVRKLRKEQTPKFLDCKTIDRKISEEPIIPLDGKDK